MNTCNYQQIPSNPNRLLPGKVPKHPHRPNSVQIAELAPLAIILGSIARLTASCFAAFHGQPLAPAARALKVSIRPVSLILVNVPEAQDVAGLGVADVVPVIACVLVLRNPKLLEAGLVGGFAHDHGPVLDDIAFVRGRVIIRIRALEALSNDAVLQLLLLSFAVRTKVGLVGDPKQRCGGE